MKTSHPGRFIHYPCLFFFPVLVLFLEPAASAQEIPKQAQRIADEIDEQIRMLYKAEGEEYEKSLLDLLNSYQSVGDLDNCLVVQKEQKRWAKQKSLRPADVVNEPPELRFLQESFVQSVSKQVRYLVQNQEALLGPKVKTLTVAGKFEEAVRTRETLRYLRRYFAPYTNPLPSTSGDGAMGPTLSADFLGRQYGKDPQKAHERYANETIDVTGEIHALHYPFGTSGPVRVTFVEASESGAKRVAADLMETESYTLKLERRTIHKLNLTFNESDETLSFRVGETVTIRGKILRQGVEVLLEEAVLPVEPTPPAVEKPPGEGPQ